VLDVLGDVYSLQEPSSLYTGPDSFDYDGDLDKAKAKVKTLLSPTPTPRNDIIRLSGLPVSLASAVLLEMELLGEIYVETDGKVSGV